jgi:outer membrane protein assembly factor BamB
MRALGLSLLLTLAACGERLTAAEYAGDERDVDTSDPGQDEIGRELMSLPFKHVEWEYRFSEYAISRMTLAGSQLFIETPDNVIIAMDRFTGATNWIHKVLTETPLDWPPVVAHGVPEEKRKLEADLRAVNRQMDDVMKEKGAGPETQKIQKKRNEIRERLRVAAFGDNCYFISRQVIYCVDRLSGSLRWSHRLDFIPGAQPFAIRNYVFVPGVDLARVWALDVEEKGKEVTYYRAGIDSRENQIMNRPLFDEPSLFFVSHDGNVYCYRVQDGSLSWTFPTGRELKADPTIHVHREVTRETTKEGKEKVREQKTRLLLVGGMDNAFYAVDGDAGSLVWKYECGAPIKSQAFATDRSVFVKTEDGALHALEIMPMHRDPKTNAPQGVRRSGNLRWKLPLGERFLVKGKDHVYVMGPKNVIFKVEELSGDVLGRYPIEYFQHIMTNPADGMLYVANGAGYVYCLMESKREF